MIQNKNITRSCIVVILILVLFGIGTSQTQRWAYVYNGPGDLNDETRPLVYGADGNIYVAGHSHGIGTEYDIAVISLTSDGTQRWLYRYNGPGNSNDYTWSLVYGADGNIYAAGSSYGIGTGDDITVISLTSTGAERWVYRYNGPGNSYDYIWSLNSLVYGADGNIYVAGRSVGSGTDFDIAVISLTSDGKERWVYRYNGPANWYDVAYDLVYGTDGNIYVAGRSVGIGTDGEFTVISLTSAGTERWVYRYGGPGLCYGDAYALAYGADGNLYVAGRIYSSGPAYDFLVISLTSAGTERWVYRYNGPGNNYDAAYSLVYGADGNIYVAGYIYAGDISFDFTVISLTSAGTERWMYRYNGPGNAQDIAYDLIYGADGNFYIAGYSIGIGTSYDFTVISITPTGTQRWVYRYATVGWDEAYSLAYGADGNLYIAGYTGWSTGTGSDFLVISLNPAIVGIEDRTAVCSPHFTINSFGNKIEFSATLSKPTNIPISVYNITGEKLLSFNINAQTGTSHHQKDLSFLPTGVYIVKVDVENRRITKKFVVVK